MSTFMNRICASLTVFLIGMIDPRLIQATEAQVPPTGTFTAAPGSGNIDLLPFFDNQNNAIPVDFPVGGQKDITPPPPQLERFDQRVLAMCGPGFDAPVSEQSFRKLLQNYPDVLNQKC
jgi:hypothetical protein